MIFKTYIKAILKEYFEGNLIDQLHNFYKELEKESMFLGFRAHSIENVGPSIIRLLFKRVGANEAFKFIKPQEQSQIENLITDLLPDGMETEKIIFSIVEDGLLECILRFPEHYNDVNWKLPA